MKLLIQLINFRLTSKLIKYTLSYEGKLKSKTEMPHRHCKKYEKSITLITIVHPIFLKLLFFSGFLVFLLSCKIGIQNLIMIYRS